MKLENIQNALKTTQFPVAYRFFNKPQVPPFICYLSKKSNNFIADGKVYHAVESIAIELYTKTKDQTAEDKVEKALSSFVWQKSETYIETEKKYQITYEIEV